MKGIHGLIVAIGLGIAAAILNWGYLAKQSNQEATIAFVGVKQGQTVNRGEILRDEHLTQLRMPARWVGNLNDLAVLYKAKNDVVGRPVWRTLTGECLLLNEDLKTPPESLKLEEGERIMWIPVESRAFTASLISPGDQVMFLVPRLTPAARKDSFAGPSAATVRPSERGRPAGPSAEMTPAHNMGRPAELDAGMVPVPERGVAAKPSSPTTDASDVVERMSDATNGIGPFRVLALGNRLGSAAVWSAAKLPVGQENVIGIGVKPSEKRKAMALWDIVQATNYRQIGIQKLGPPQKPQSP